MSLRDRIARLEQRERPDILCVNVYVGDDLAPFGTVGGQRFARLPNEPLCDFKARMRGIAVERGQSTFVIGGLERPGDRP